MADAQAYTRVYVRLGVKAWVFFLCGLLLWVPFSFYRGYAAVKSVLPAGLWWGCLSVEWLLALVTVFSYFMKMRKGYVPSVITFGFKLAVSVWSYVWLWFHFLPVKPSLVIVSLVMATVIEYFFVYLFYQFVKNRTAIAQLL